MIRLVGILVGLGFTFVVLLAFVTGAYTVATEGFADEAAEHAFHIEAGHTASDESQNVDFQFEGALGTWDVAQLQRGYQVYKEVCSACHSLDLVAFRNLGEIGYNDAQVKAEAAAWQVPGINGDTGEVTTVPGKPQDYFPSPYANNVAAGAANNNAVPPDLSLMTKARHHGTDYVYSLLTGYADPAAHENANGETLAERFPDSTPSAGLYFNPYFANLNLAMSPPLTSAGQVTYADGTEASVDQMSQDVAAFLTWTAEPSMVERRQLGWPVMGFLLLATILAWMAMKQIWAGLPKKNED